jgi:hypothetical protein
MKRYCILFVSLILGCSAILAQSAPVNFLPEALDSTKIDLSTSRFLFLGPMDIYAEGLRYGDQQFRAVLRYDGEGEISIAVPDSSPRLMPKSIDLSGIRIEYLPQSQVRISGLVIDGYLWTGILGFEGSGRLVVAEGFKAQGPAPVALNPDQTAQTERLQGQIQTLQGDLANKDRLIGGLQARTDAILWDNASKDLQIGSLQTQVSAFERDNAAKDLLIGSLQTRADTIPALETRSRQLHEQVQQLNSSMVLLNERLISLNARLNKSISTALPVLGTTVLDGFAGGRNLLGTWHQTAVHLEQTDARQLYAKYSIPLVQRGEEYLYTIKASSDQAGRVGFGLHFLASGALARNGYGFGSSYLIWLTKDPARHQSADSYIQLYRSYSDVHMVQIASAAIPFDLKDGVETTVHVNRARNEIRVFLNGYFAFAFPTEAAIADGVSVVLRSLGNVRFSQLTVRGN